MTAPTHDDSEVFDLADDIVQLLTVAKYALEAGATDQATRSIDEALALARHAITELSEATLVARGSQTMLGYALRSREARAADPQSAAQHPDS